MKEAIEIIDEHVYLQKAFKYIIKNNKSNGIPYHNLNHLLTVLKYVYDGIKAEGIVDEDVIKCMLIAALFHDVDHSGGKEKDDVNVARSKIAIQRFFGESNVPFDVDIANEMLDATEYPYKI
jgi:hypothetical protein